MDKPKKSVLEIRQLRTFSEEFKRQKVQLIVEKKVSIADVSTIYKVSKVTVYRWLYRYSADHEQGAKQVVQMQSEEYKTKELLRQVAELERAVGQKQLQVDYLERLVQLSGESLKIDLKKTFGGPRLSGSDSTKTNTAGQ
jgi:transposase-like protein